MMEYNATQRAERDRHAELAALAQRLIACADFEYRPGMAVLRHPAGFGGPEDPIRIVATPGDKLLLYVPGADLQTINRSEAPIIDLSDPATFGILVDQFLMLGGSTSDSNPFWLAFQWAAEAMTPDRIVDAFEYSMHLPF
jgi:hypothetical protein